MNARGPSEDCATSSSDQLVCLLKGLDQLLERAVDAARASFGSEWVTDPYRGLHIGDREVARLLEREPCESSLPGALGATLAGIDAHGSRIGVLADRFNLSSFDIGVVAIALAPELDLRYERLYAYLQDDVTRKRPSVSLVLDLLSNSVGGRLEARRHFAPEAPLIRNGLLEIVDDPSYSHPPLLSRYLKLSERIVNHLVGFDDVDTRLYRYVRLVRPEIGFEELLFPDEFKRRLIHIARTRTSSVNTEIFHFKGPYGVGKRAAAEAVCRATGIRLLIVDGEALENAAKDTFEGMLQSLTRESHLQGAAIYWDGVDVLLAADRMSQRETLLRAIGDSYGVGFVGGNADWQIETKSGKPRCTTLEFPPLKAAERERLWRLFINSEDPPSLDVKALAARFRFSGGQIRDALEAARSLARLRDGARPELTTADLYAASRAQSNRRLTTLAQKITPHYSWEDIVLPADKLQQLREVCNQVKFAALVYEDWGFNRKLSLGKGLNVLFAGPSGTGKTMSAEIIAGELGLDLYKIDLSTVVSKYIGETEKNLARIFSEAETSNAVLFFDEADALFGKRSEVKDAHDRYANIEVGFLLQKMEEYTGVVILATNLRKNMDEAFVRRMHFAVEFPFPGEEDRRRIWDQIWPEVAPRARDLDTGFLARRFEIAGGSIRNIAVAAAFLAAADGGTVGMPHLMRATQREYQKMGKVVSEGEFASG